MQPFTRWTAPPSPAGLRASPSEMVPRRRTVDGPRTLYSIPAKLLATRGALAGESVAQFCPEADAQEAGEGSIVTAVARSPFHNVRG